ncbi:hypothetical protein OB03_10570 [Brevundimonas sp. GN22]
MASFSVSAIWLCCVMAAAGLLSAVSRPYGVLGGVTAVAACFGLLRLQPAAEWIGVLSAVFALSGLFAARRQPLVSSILAGVVLGAGMALYTSSGVHAGLSLGLGVITTAVAVAVMQICDPNPRWAGLVTAVAASGVMVLGLVPNWIARWSAIQADQGGASAALSQLIPFWAVAALLAVAVLGAFIGSRGER